MTEPISRTTPTSLSAPSSSENSGARAADSTLENSAQLVSPQEAQLTLVGIMLGMFLAALDQTIVSTALPRIVADLNGSSYYAWVTTAYLLASTVAAPIFGRLTELFSRKTILLVAIAIFLGGSALCGLAQNMPMLIVFRGIQGIGGGALFALAFTTIAVLFPPRDRARVGGLFGAVFGISSAVGPWLGGLLTDHLSWHWVFYVNMPIGLVALGFILRYMPRLNPSHNQSFDFLGAFLLVVWTVPLMLGFSWAGVNYAWGSVQIIGLFALAAVGLGAWIYSQTRVRDPLFDLSVLRIRSFSTSSLAFFFFGPAFLGAIAFLPLYLQQVKGISASQSGVTVLPLTLGLLVGAISSGILARKIGRYKGILLGGVLWLLAMFLVLHFVLAVDTPLWLAVILFTLLGLGLGPMQSLLQIAGQNDLPMSRIGSGTAASQFVRQIGSTIGIALLGTVLSSTIQHDVCKALPSSKGCLPGAAAAPRNQNQSIAALNGQFKALEAQVTAAIQGDPKAYAAIQGNPQISDAAKKQIPAGGVPVKFQKVAIEQATANLEKTKITLETAFKDGITHAEQNIFLWGAFFVLISAGFIVALPNAELKGGPGGARGEGGPPAAAH